MGKHTLGRNLSSVGTLKSVLLPVLVKVMRECTLRRNLLSVGTVKSFTNGSTCTLHT